MSIFSGPEGQRLEGKDLSAGEILRRWQCDKGAVAARVNGRMVDLFSPVSEDASVEPVEGASEEGLEILRHSAAHLMAQAVQRLYPGAKFGVGPAIKDGFYYDMELPRRLLEEDLPRIEDEMRRLAQEDIPVTRREFSRDEALAFFRDRGQSYKEELIAEIPEGEGLSCYEQGDFADLCRGPHVPSTGAVRHFKLLSVAGAYWRGSEQNPMLTRVYGTAWDSAEALKHHLEMLEEIEKRDHRRLGRDLDLFSVHEEAGPGLIYWHPKGGRLRVELENWWRQEHFAHGYDILFTPHLGRSWLWETSGHLGFYKENMYSPMEIDKDDYYVKPMNCPFHILVYKTRTRSYRDLPLRWAELGTVYRYERSGVLHGCMRVRGFTQDDAHIICTPEQIEDEILEVLRFSMYVWRTLGFSEVKAYLATRPEKSVGDDASWQTAAASLRKAIEAEGLSYEVDEGGGAFYGPKIDLKVRDAVGREWQVTTIQFDFNLPERFDMTFTDADGKEKRPFMVHRALLGSLERFFGILIEHYAGAFPYWLAPVQARIIPVASDHGAYAAEVEKTLRGWGVRVEVDARDEKLGKRIRDAQMQKIPYMLVIGDRERDGGTVAVRERAAGDLGGMTMESLRSRLDGEFQPLRNLGQ
ncbi:MAG TPA: threonine--tRNA ligase [Synergistaceae bacterium]|nr:threonine--tRNA ligase [Synergistaceae bacterium]